MFQWLRNLFGASSSSNGESPNTQTYTLESIPVRGVLTILGESYVVEQKITYIENGFQWFDYRLKLEGKSGYWLSVELDDRVDVRLYETLEEGPTSVAETLQWNGRHYKQAESGKCDAVIENDSGKSTRHKVKYFNYESDIDDTSDNTTKYLSALSWSHEDGAELEWAQGHDLTPDAVDILGVDTSADW